MSGLNEGGFPVQKTEKYHEKAIFSCIERVAFFFSKIWKIGWIQRDSAKKQRVMILLFAL